MSWRTDAKAAIAGIHAELPADANLEQRKKALFDGYPFGIRQYTPYKIWCEEKNKYLAPFDPNYVPPVIVHLSPLERLKKRCTA